MYSIEIQDTKEDGQIRRLQAVQNATARLVSGARRPGHVSPILRSLHWLPVQRRVTFKFAVIAWKSVNGVAPTYLLELDVPVDERERERESLFATKQRTNIKNILNISAVAGYQKGKPIKLSW